MRALTTLIERSQLTDDLMVFRGVSGEYGRTMRNRVVGEVFTETGFTSTSVHSAKAFGGVKLRILVPRGTRSIALDKYGLAPHKNEMEILIQRNTRFEVLERTTSGNQKRMTLRVVDQATPP